MKDQRIKLLEKYVLDDPNDTFSIYALALELRDSNPSRTAELFDRLLEHHPQYEGSYYQAAEFFASQGERQKAEGVYEAGIALFKANENFKALNELQNAYQNFLFDED